MESPIEPQAEELEAVAAEPVPEGEAASRVFGPQDVELTAEELEALGCTAEELAALTNALNAAHERAKRDLKLLLVDNQMPAEGETYGPWTPQMRRLLYTAKTKNIEAAWQVLEAALRDKEPWAVIFMQWGQPHKEEEEPSWDEWMEEYHRWVEASEEEKRRIEAREAGAPIGDRIADTILAELKKRACSRADLYARFGRSVSAEQLDRALFTLHRQGRVTVKVSRSGGRPREMWMLWKEEKAR